MSSDQDFNGLASFIMKKQGVSKVLATDIFDINTFSAVS